MRISLEARNLVCLAPMPPSAFDLRALEGELDPGKAEAEISDPQVTMGHYPDFQVIVRGGRLQLEAVADGKDDSLRAAAVYLLAQAAPYKPTALGFNAVASIATDEEDDPTAGLLDLGKLAERLRAQGGRGGVEYVFHRDGGRWTIAVNPEPDDQRLWSATQNRHHEGFPTDTESLLDWFIGLNETYPAQIAALLEDG